MAGDPVFFRIAPLPRSYSMTSGEAARRDTKRASEAADRAAECIRQYR